MTGLLIYIKHHFAFLWNMVERLNGMLCAWRYRHAGQIAAVVCESVKLDNLRFSLVTQQDIPRLSLFLNSQPANYIKHFNPHRFDEPTLYRLLHNPSFIMMKVATETDNSIVGYFFLRCFFIGRAFHGLIVDAQSGGNGIGTAMWRTGMAICERNGLRMFATISKSNVASLHSCQKAVAMGTVKTLRDDYLLIECKHERNE